MIEKRKRRLRAVLVSCLAFLMLMPLVVANAQNARAITLSDLVQVALAMKGEVELTPEQREEYGIQSEGPVTLTNLVHMAEEFRAQVEPSTAPSGPPIATPAPSASIAPTPPPQLIGDKVAREIAVAAVPGATDANITSCKLEDDDDAFGYEVELTYDGAEYDIDIHPYSGEIVKESMDRPVPTGLGNQSLGEAAIRAIAVAEVEGATDDSITECTTDMENGTTVYDITIRHREWRWEFEIVAATGEIVERTREQYIEPVPMPTMPPEGPTGSPGPSQTPAVAITSERAQAIALEKVPGATAANVIKCEQDVEDGVQVYEVEIHFNGWDYDFEIAIGTGEILKSSAEEMRPQATQGNLIGTDRAQEIALQRVPGAAASDIVKCELDSDDGVRVYEVEIIYGGREYDFEIHGVLGKVIKETMEVLFVQPSPSPIPTDRPQPTATATPTIIISEQRAREIALERVPGASNANITKCKLDREDGIQVYEIEIVYNGTEHDFEINANDGTIIKTSTEPADDPMSPTTRPTAPVQPTPAPTAGIITAQRAQEIALGRVPGATTANVTKCELDWEDGIQIYEIEIKYGRYEYEFEIGASTGSIISMDVDD